MRCDGLPPAVVLASQNVPTVTVMGRGNVRGEVVAFVFGRRTHAAFRRLSALLASAQIRVSQWVTDAGWWFAATGLQRLSRSTQTDGRQIPVAELGTQAPDPAYSFKTISLADDLFFQVGGNS